MPRIGHPRRRAGPRRRRGRRRAPSPRRAPSTTPRALDADRHAVLDHHLRQARPATRCPPPPTAAAGTARPSGVRPDAGLSTPSASFGSPWSGDITTPARGERDTGTRHPLTPDPIASTSKCRWKTMNSADHRRGQHARAGQDRPERVRRAGRHGADVVRQRHRERLHGLLLGDQERPQELVPRTDERQQHRGQQRRLARAGSRSCRRIVSSLAPSMRAASKSSLGNCRKNCRKMNTAVELMANGRIMPR